MTRVMPRHNGPEQRRVADVAANELHARAPRDRLTVRQDTRIGQLVQDSHARILETAIAAREHRADVVRADEPGATDYQDPHHGCAASLTSGQGLSLPNALVAAACGVMS